MRVEIVRGNSAVCLGEAVTPILHSWTFVNSLLAWYVGLTWPGGYCGWEFLFWVVDLYLLLSHAILMGRLLNYKWFMLSYGPFSGVLGRAKEVKVSYFRLFGIYIPNRFTLSIFSHSLFSRLLLSSCSFRSLSRCSLRPCSRLAFPTFRPCRP